MHSDWCIHSTCPSHNSFQILMTSFKLLESTQFSHRSLTVLENIQVLVKRVVPPISDLLPTVISLTAALGCTCFRQAVPRSNSALSKRNLTCDLLQELQNILFTKIAGKYISVQWNLLSGMFRKTNKSIAEAWYEPGLQEKILYSTEKNIISIFHSRWIRFTTTHRSSNSCFREVGWGTSDTLFKKEY